MDVPVSHLNNRLALQLPAQLPLGLVFVLGEVEKFVNEDNGDSTHKQFNLIEEEHQVRCLLSERVLSGVNLQEGSNIRAGGHLIFDPTRADYYLLVRDIEIVQTSSSEPLTTAVTQDEMNSIMDDVRKRAEAANMVQSELPPWVEKMAPIKNKEGVAGTDNATVSREKHSKELNNKQLAQLTAAMDSEDDVELTSGLLEVAKKLNQVRGIQPIENNSYGIQLPVSEARYAYPSDIEDPDILKPTGKITTDRILMLVIIVALALFLLIMLLFIVRGF